jgi:hypothetical protein
MIASSKRPKYLIPVAILFLLLVLGGGLGLFLKFSKNSPLSENTDKNEDENGNKTKSTDPNFQPDTDIQSDNYNLSPAEKLDELNLLVEALKEKSPKGPKKLAIADKPIYKTFKHAIDTGCLSIADIKNCINICNKSKKFEDNADALYVSFRNIRDSPLKLINYFPSVLSSEYKDWFNKLVKHYEVLLDCNDITEFDPSLLKQLLVCVTPAIRKGILQENPPSSITETFINAIEAKNISMDDTERLANAIEAKAFSLDDLGVVFEIERHMAGNLDEHRAQRMITPEEAVIIKKVLSQFPDIFPHCNSVISYY